MALFKILRGSHENLPDKITDGYCYFTTDTGMFYIDTDTGRLVLNANNAQTLLGKTVITDITKDSVDIPTSGAVWKAINNLSETTNSALDTKMNKKNPTGTGYFSLNRKNGTTVGKNSFSEGSATEASGEASHAEGLKTNASNMASHSEGARTYASGPASHAEGADTSASGNRAHAEGDHTNAIGDYSHAEGYYTQATGKGSHAEGNDTYAKGDYSHTEGAPSSDGTQTQALKSAAHAEGLGALADGMGAHAEGGTTRALGDLSHAEGHSTLAQASFSHAEGDKSEAYGDGSHAEGTGTVAYGADAHSEGGLTVAAGYHSHAEGYGTQAHGESSHAQGRKTFTPFYQSSVSGAFNEIDVNVESDINFNDLNAIGVDDYAINTSYSKDDVVKHKGVYYKAKKDHISSDDLNDIYKYDNWEMCFIRSERYRGEFTMGARYVSTNVVLYDNNLYVAINDIESASESPDIDIENWYPWSMSNSLNKGKYAHVVGNGTSEDNRSNAATLDWDGNAWFAGDVVVGEGKTLIGLEDIPHVKSIPTTLTYGRLLKRGELLYLFLDSYVFISKDNGYTFSDKIQLFSSDTESGVDPNTDLNTFITIANATPFLLPDNRIAVYYRCNNTVEGSIENYASIRMRYIDENNNVSSPNLIVSSITSYNNTENIDKTIGGLWEPLPDNSQYFMHSTLETNLVLYYCNSMYSDKSQSVDFILLDEFTGLPFKEDQDGNILTADDIIYTAISNKDSEGNPRRPGMPSIIKYKNQSYCVIECNDSVHNKNINDLNGTNKRASIELYRLDSGFGEADYITTLFQDHDAESSGAPYIVHLSDGRIAISFQSDIESVEGISSEVKDNNMYSRHFYTYISKEHEGSPESRTYVPYNNYDFQSNESGYYGSLAEINGTLYSVFTRCKHQGEGKPRIIDNLIITNKEIPQVLLNLSNGQGLNSVVEGFTSKATGINSHAEGQNAQAKGTASHAEGVDTMAYANGSHAEGINTTASANGSHAEGKLTIASGYESHAEGYGTIAGTDDSIVSVHSTAAKQPGYFTHAEGHATRAYGHAAHSEGYKTNAAGDYSHAEGVSSSPHVESIVPTTLATDILNLWTEIVDNNEKFSIAKGEASHVEGKDNLALSTGSHAEGVRTISSNAASHAEGADTIASGNRAHAEGDHTKASAPYSHAEGNFSEALGKASHVEGRETLAIGESSHAEGEYTVAYGNQSHAEGYGNNEPINIKISGDKFSTVYNINLSLDNSYLNWIVSYNKNIAKIIDINNTMITLDKTLSSSALDQVDAIAYNSGAVGKYSHSEGLETQALGDQSHAEGNKTNAKGVSSHAEGQETIASGIASHAEGKYTKATSYESHAEGYGTVAGEEEVQINSSAYPAYYFTHAEGHATKASGHAAHSEGRETFASNIATHAEGLRTQATGKASHAEGADTIASGDAAHAEGDRSKALGQAAHAEGAVTTAYYRSHAEGVSTIAGATGTSAQGAHAEGNNTKALHAGSHAEGYYTTTSNNYQHVEGKYNYIDTSKTYAHVTGWGSSDDNRKNIHTLDTSGNAWFAGDIYIKSTSGTNKDNGSKKIATEESITSGSITAKTATDATNAKNIYSSASTSKAYILGTTTASSANHATVYNASVYTSGSVLYGAAWNDYAEYRDQIEIIEPGYCVVSADNGQVSKTTEKFQACDGIVSDTFGFAIGETEQCKTPLAVAGRVLAYCEGDRLDYHAGDTVCAGPNGKVVKMTREEIREWPDRIVGTVSEIPMYETWGTGNVAVNGRIWIKIK